MPNPWGPERVSWGMHKFERKPGYFKALARAGFASLGQTELFGVGIGFVFMISTVYLWGYWGFHLSQFLWNYGAGHSPLFSAGSALRVFIWIFWVEGLLGFLLVDAKFLIMLWQDRPDWGAWLAEGRHILRDAWWLAHGRAEDITLLASTLEGGGQIVAERQLALAFLLHPRHKIRCLGVKLVASSSRA